MTERESLAETIAEQLLGPIWRGIPAAYKRTYARNIWQQFEDQIRSAAYTSRVSVFFDIICRKLDVRIYADDLARVQACMARADRPVLSLLRTETTYLVLLVRIANESRRASGAPAVFAVDMFGEEESE